MFPERKIRWHYCRNGKGVSTVNPLAAGDPGAGNRAAPEETALPQTGRHRHTELSEVQALSPEMPPGRS